MDGGEEERKKEVRKNNEEERTEMKEMSSGRLKKKERKGEKNIEDSGMLLGFDFFFNFEIYFLKFF